MPKIDWDVIKSVLAEYDLNVTEVRTESYKEKKGVWWVKTPYGYKILKKHSNSRETIEFILAAVEYLQGKGIRIPDIIRTTGGEKYVYRDGHCYIMSQAVAGNNPSYNRMDELRRMVEELGRFHSASGGFVPPRDAKPRVHLGGWIEDHNRQRDKLEKYYLAESTCTEHTAFGETILKEFPYFLNRIKRSVEGLETSGYARWVSQAESSGCLCHQDFAAGNLMMTEAGETYVLDTDSITIDIPARDIRKLLLKVMKKRGQWDMRLTKDMLAWYQRENPLESWQWQVLKWELVYPHLFAGIMGKYYEKREESWTEGKYLKRLKEMVDMERSVDPVIDSFESLIPR